MAKETDGTSKNRHRFRDLTEIIARTLVIEQYIEEAIEIKKRV